MGCILFESWLYDREEDDHTYKSMNKMVQLVVIKEIDSLLFKFEKMNSFYCYSNKSLRKMTKLFIQERVMGV